MLVSYASAFNRAQRGRQAAEDAEAGVVFFPSGSAVLAYDTLGGDTLATFRGPRSTINACCWAPSTGQLLAATDDGSVYAWTHASDEGAQGEPDFAAVPLGEDNEWYE